MLGLEQIPLFAVLSAADLDAVADLAEARSFVPGAVICRRRVERCVGVREVLSRSWEMLSWWHGAAEAEGVDVLLGPITRSQTGYNFSAIDQMIEVVAAQPGKGSP